MKNADNADKKLSLFDSTAIIIGSMIGSGIFIVSADISRQVQTPGMLLMAWVVTGVMTILAALSYGELAAAMPKAGGQYVYIREAFGKMPELCRYHTSDTADHREPDRNVVFVAGSDELAQQTDDGPDDDQNE